MRDIKFRAWGKRRQGDNVLYEPCSLSEMIKGVWPKDDTGFIWMQFTGLKDKNRKEIYEGNIMRVNTGGDDEVYEVKYFGGEGYPAFDLDRKENASECYGLSEAVNMGDVFEVIGNIYENPELLKS